MRYLAMSDNRNRGSENDESRIERVSSRPYENYVRDDDKKKKSGGVGRDEETRDKVRSIIDN